MYTKVSRIANCLNLKKEIYNFVEELTRNKLNLNFTTRNVIYYSRNVLAIPFKYKVSDRFVMLVGKFKDLEI